MAQSRLEKIGTIFTRVKGLLRGGAMKPEDKPIWYDVYAAFPPKLEPRFDRPAPNIPIRNIFYAEDVVRAKFHKQNRPNDTINLIDHKRATQTQQFIKIYDGLKDQGALDEQRIYETAVDLLAEQRLQQQIRNQSPDDSFSAPELDLDPVPPPRGSLVSEFQLAAEKQDGEMSQNRAKKERNVGVDINSLFKD